MRAEGTYKSKADVRWLQRFDALAARFHELRCRSETLSCTYSVASRRLRFVACSADALQKLGSTMGHLRCGETDGEVLEVYVGHDNDAEIEQLWRNHCELDGRAATRPRLVLGDGCNVLGAVWPAAGMMGLIERGSGRALVWLRDVNQVRVAEAATLVRALVSWWLLDEDYTVVHAGAVAGARGAALLVGAGGTGKSSTSVACFETGLNFLADDSVLCRVGSGEVFSLSACASIYGRDLAGHHASLHDSPPLEVGRDGKVVLDLARVAPQRVIARAPICALVRLTRNNESATRIDPVARPRIMAALAPSSVFNIPSPEHETFSRVCALVRSLPTYELHLSGNRAEAARLMANLLQDRISS